MKQAAVRKVAGKKAAAKKAGRQVRQRRSGRRPIDRRLWVLTLALVAFGLVMVFSASTVLSNHQYDDGTVYFRSQLFKAALGVLLMFFVAAIDYRVWQRLAKPILWLALATLLLLAVGLGGGLTPEVNGARRWISLPGFTFQPIELARLALVIWMAATIARKGEKLDRPSEGLVPLLVLPAVMAGLVLLQPDFKGALLLGLLAGVLLYLGGVRRGILGRIAAAGVPLAGLIMILEPYRMRRLAAFLDRTEDIQGISYQINQSLISLGSGGWLGVGLSSSKQKFAFLPMAHTDFIVSIIGEELGFVGSITLLAAFLFLGARGYRIARRAPDFFGFLLGSGITTLILLSALLNIGVATAALPTTGLPLPFISYGGTALVVNLLAVGILLSLSRDQVEEPPRRAKTDRLLHWWPFKKEAA